MTAKCKLRKYHEDTVEWFRNSLGDNPYYDDLREALGQIALENKEDIVNWIGGWITYYGLYDILDIGGGNGQYSQLLVDNNLVENIAVIERPTTDVLKGIIKIPNAGPLDRLNIPTGFNCAMLNEVIHLNSHDFAVRTLSNLLNGGIEYVILGENLNDNDLQWRLRKFTDYGTTYSVEDSVNVFSLAGYELLETVYINNLYFQLYRVK